MQRAEYVRNGAVMSRDRLRRRRVRARYVPHT